MADVVFVCVRDDVERAEALAEVFDRAGFSVETQFDDDALETCAASVVVLSATSARSDSFIALAHQVIDAGKAVIVSLVASPASANTSSVIDLSSWEGGASDAALEPIVDAVDRLVRSARANATLLLIETAPRHFASPPEILRDRAPPAITKTPRKYLPRTAQRNRTRVGPRVVFFSVACAVLALSAAVGAHAVQQPARPAAAQTVALQSPGAPVVSFESAVANVSAASVTYRPEPEIAPILSPSRAEPPSAGPMLRELRRPDAPRHYARARALRTPSFIDGSDAPA